MVGQAHRWRDGSQGASHAAEQGSCGRKADKSLVEGLVEARKHLHVRVQYQHSYSPRASLEQALTDANSDTENGMLDRSSLLLESDGLQAALETVLCRRYWHYLKLTPLALVNA